MDSRHIANYRNVLHWRIYFLFFLHIACCPSVCFCGLLEGWFNKQDLVGGGGSSSGEKKKHDDKKMRLTATCTLTEDERFPPIAPLHTCTLARPPSHYRKKKKKKKSRRLPARLAVSQATVATLSNLNI